MAKKRVFISFDFHHNRLYRYLLAAFNENPANDIEFIDSTPGVIDTMNVGRVKAVLTTKIRSARHTLVLIGDYANTPHKDRGRSARGTGNGGKSRRARKRKRSSSV